MPVDFLTEEQEQRYGRYTSEPSPAQLTRYFHLDDADRERIAACRGAYNKLGYALQLGTVRFLGTFLTNPIDAPAGVIRFLATQLGLSETTDLSTYREGRQHWEHANEIKEAYGYRDFQTQPDLFRLTRWLYTRAWLGAERPIVLFDLTTARLVEHKILLPGVSVLERLVARVRDHAQERLWHVLAEIPTAEQRYLLETLLVVPQGERQTPLDRLRRAPTRITAPALVSALRRIDAVRLLGVHNVDLSFVLASRIKALARYVLSARVQTISRMPEDRRIATLLAFASAFEATAHDDALDLFDLLLRTAFSRAQREGQQERLRTIRDLDAAALTLASVGEIVLDQTQDPATLWERIFACVEAPQLQAAVTAVGELTRPPDDNNAQELLERYTLMRRFLPTLLRTLDFESTQGGQTTLEAVHFLRGIEGHRNPRMHHAPLDMVSRAWRRYVVNREQEVNRPAYTLCVVERLQEALRRHDIFVTPSERWGDPRAKLLQGEAWEGKRAQVCRTLNKSETPGPDIAALQQELDEAYRRVAENLPSNAAVRIEQRDEQDHLTLTGLDRLEEPESLQRLRAQVNARLPLVELPELLLEIQAHTRFADAFTHLSEGNARADELPLTLCAVLVAEACNIGLTPVTHRNTPALTRDRLLWFQQNYLRAETLTRGNAMLVDAHAQLPLANIWGSGEVASADGLRFVVPVRSINTGPSPRYFGVSRGVTYFNFTSDQFSGFHAIVIPGTIRDSLYILAGLLEQQTSLHPTVIMTDSASYSDLVFGLFWLLGYQFSPRLADIGETRFWRVDETADYGALDGIARHRINTNLISQNWDDMLRVAGSLKLGTVSAPLLMCKFGNSDGGILIIMPLCGSYTHLVKDELAFQ